MDLFSATTLHTIDNIERPTKQDLWDKYISRNRPVIIKGVANQWPCFQKWTLDYIESKVERVKIQKPSEDGLYHFLNFNWMSFTDFRKTLTTSMDVYLSANRLMGDRGGIPEDDHLQALIEDLPPLRYFEPEEMGNANLWIGPGGNKTLLHYDPWHSFLMLIEGKKRFSVYHPSQTPYLSPYTLFDFNAVREGRIMDSRLNPDDIQDEFLERTRNAEGYYGELEPGQMLYIPAGAWHYVESQGMNIAVNYFYHTRDEGLWSYSPLRDHRIKTKYYVPTLDLARKLKAGIRTVAFPMSKKASP